jgi:type IV pilus assembly protein PilX
MIIYPCSNIKKQPGFILITTLVLLGMLTILGVSQVSINSTQTKVAANTTDSEISFEKTEGAMNEAIRTMINRTYSNDSFLKNSNGLYLFKQDTAPAWKTVDWGSGAVITGFNGLSGSQAKYIIEQLPSVVKPGQNMKTTTRIYRITARALGQNGSSSVLLQSTIQIQQ